MNPILKRPCAACPYRRDVPAGVWHPDEYAKLPQYDAPTGEQPVAAFACHAAPAKLCHGWAVCHSNRGHDRELLALRVMGVSEVPVAAVPLFTSGREAAGHGLSGVKRPGRRAVAAAKKLMGRHERLREANP